MWSRTALRLAAPRVPPMVTASVFDGLSPAMGRRIAVAKLMSRVHGPGLLADVKDPVAAVTVCHDLWCLLSAGERAVYMRHGRELPTHVAAVKTWCCSAALRQRPASEAAGSRAAGGPDALPLAAIIGHQVGSRRLPQRQRQRLSAAVPAWPPAGSQQTVAPFRGLARRALLFQQRANAAVPDVTPAVRRRRYGHYLVAEWWAAVEAAGLQKAAGALPPLPLPDSVTTIAAEVAAKVEAAEKASNKKLRRKMRLAAAEGQS